MSNEDKIDLQILGKIRHLIPNNFIIERIKKHEVYKNTGIVKTTQLKSSNRFTLEQNDKYDEFCDILDSFTFGNDLQVIKQFDNFKETIKPKIAKGSTFNVVNGVESIDLNTLQTKKGSFRPLQDKTNLIIFWSSEVSKSTRALNQLNSWLNQNQQLKLNINAIAISLDNDSNKLKAYLKDNKVQEFQHYRFTLGWDQSNDFQKALELNYLPKILVIGRDNYVLDVTTKSKKVEDIIQLYLKSPESFQDSEEVQTHREIIEKEPYKLIKTKLNQSIGNQLSQNTQFAKSDFIKLSLIKSNKINFDGSKQLFERTHLIIAYDVSVQSEQILQQFLNDIKKQIGNDNVHISKQLIKDPNGIVHKLSNAFQDVLTQNNKVISQFTIKTENYKYVHDKQVFQQETSSNEIQGIFNLKISEYQTLYSQIQPIFQKYQEEIDESDEEHDHEAEQQQDRNLINNHINQLKNSLRSGLQLTVGQQFQSIYNYHKFGQDKMEQIVHKENEILIIFYWNDNKESDRLFPNIIKFLLTNEDSFKDKVRFVALSQHKFDYYEHYFIKNQGIEEVIDFYFPQEESQVDQQQYQVKAFPHLIIVDKIGNIRLLQGTLEDLESLVENQLEEEINNLKQLSNLTEEQHNQITQFLISDASKNLVQLNNKRQSSIDIKFIEILQGENKTRLVPILNYTIREGREKNLEVYLKLLNKVYPLQKFQVNKTTQKTLNLLFPGKACKLCQNELNDQTPQYYSPFSDEFYCVKCAEVFDQKAIGNNKLRVKDNLIFFNAPLVDKSVLNDIDVYRLGNNLKVKKGDPFSQRHAIDCNGCDKEIRGFRYIVLNCLPGKITDMALVDFCQDCFNQIRHGGANLEKIVKRTSMYGYNPSMVLLRIPFYMGYYEY